VRGSCWNIVPKRKLAANMFSYPSSSSAFLSLRKISYRSEEQPRISSRSSQTSAASSDSFFLPHGAVPPNLFLQSPPPTTRKSRETRGTKELETSIGEISSSP
jgi:hypothetical protein